MKKYILILLMLFAFINTTKAQDVRFTANTITDLSAMQDDGFNMGFNIEYQMTYMYFRAGVFFFPELRGKDYMDITGVPLGFNIHIGRYKKLRLATGFKLGIIIRDNNPHPTAGNEHFFEWYPKGIENGLYFGLGGSYDYRTDGKVWDIDVQNYFRYSSKVKLGFTF